MPGIQQLLNIYPSGGYSIYNSLRFRASASAYLSRVITLSATWTLSVWVKRGALGATSPIFGGSVLFNSNDTLTAGTLTTTAVYRDPSAWYHIVVSNSGCYVNGVSVGSTATGILVSPLIGSNAVNYFDGYLADINFIDGQALTPSYFGQFSTITGVWQPIAYSGTYGTNGFHLKFNNGTSTTTLGYDSSGNGNNWTTNNISLTAGSTYDWMIDSPTPFAGSSYGVGNYAVWNAIKLQGNSASNANLTATLTAGGPPYLAGYGVRSTMAAPSSGKWYCEITPVSSDTWSYVGVTDINGWATDVGNSGQYSVLYRANGDKNVNGTASSYGASYTTDTIGIALDIDSGTVTFYKNNTSQGAISLPSSTISYCFVVSNGNAQAVSFNANFGQRPFTYTPPTGFKSLCTYNLPAASIVNGAGYMAATTYTGNGTSQSIANTVNGVSFQPDFVWIKDRSVASAHALTNSVIGITKYLESNTTAAETTDTNSVTSLNSNGFSLGAGTSIYYTNRSGESFIAWQWKANGTAVSNTAGSITSQVSANTIAGFSVVTYTGTGSAGTVGHGLGVAPAMILNKSRNAAYNWHVYFTSLGTGDFEGLNTTAAYNSGSNWFNNASVSSTVFPVGASQGTATYVCYCFAAIPGYSAFGSFAGNASTDGAFIYTGFRPRLVMVKCSSGTGNWYMLDSSRNTYNVVNNQLYPNLSNAETSATTLDILSNGFKMRTSSDPNASATYIYAAWAESPFQNSLAY